MIKHWLSLCTRRLPVPAIHSGVKKQGGIVERNQTHRSLSFPSTVGCGLFYLETIQTDEHVSQRLGPLTQVLSLVQGEANLPALQ